MTNLHPIDYELFTRSYPCLEEQLYYQTSLDESLDYYFNARIINSLRKINVYTFGDLLSKSQQELLEIDNFGTNSLLILVNTLHSFGFNLKQYKLPFSSFNNYDKESKND